MSLHKIKRSIFALPMLTTAAIASIFALDIVPSASPSQIQQSAASSEVVAYRASGRFDTALELAYRASGRFGTGVEDFIAYRGSERGVEPVAYRASGRFGDWGTVISYRASGRFESLAYRGSERGVDTVAYRASGRFDNGFGGLAYRGSERGVDTVASA